MRAPTQFPLFIWHDDPIVDFIAEDIGRRHAENPAALQAEIADIREAIRSNWREMDDLKLAQTNRPAIRATVARLEHLLTALLALSAQGPNKFGAAEIEKLRSEGLRDVGNVEILSPGCGDEARRWDDPREIRDGSETAEESK